MKPRPFDRCLPIILASGLFFIGSPAAWAGAYLSKASGIVEVRRAGKDRWELARELPVDIKAHDSVRTGQRASTTLAFDDGSLIELGPNAALTLDEASSSRTAIKHDFGALRAFVQKIPARRFEVKTPTAVCAVRGTGTEFKSDVLTGGRTVVDLYKGLLGIEDRRGQQILLHPNERIEVDLRGLTKAAGLPTKVQQRRTAFHQLMEREVGLEMAKADVLANAAREIKLPVFQQGQASVNVEGQRVRVEEYILRPAANEFKLVVLNENQGGLNLYSFLGIFNTTLPQNLNLALNQLNGTLDVAPTWFLTGFQTVRSNVLDTIAEKATGGHPVDVNNNGVPGDAVSLLFNPVTNSYVSVAAGRSVFQTLFDNYGFYVEGKLAYGWTGANIQTYSTSVPLVTHPTLSSANDPFTNAPLTTANAFIDPGTGQLATVTRTTTFPDASEIHQVVYDSYSSGDWVQWDNYSIGSNGQLATTANFQGATSGTSYLQGLLNFAYEQVITSSQFQGRKIDIVLNPEFFVETGLQTGFVGLIH